MGRSEMEMPATSGKMENAASDIVLQQKVSFCRSDGLTRRTLGGMLTGVLCTRLTK